MSFELSQIGYSHSGPTWWGTDRVYTACITKFLIFLVFLIFFLASGALEWGLLLARMASKLSLLLHGLVPAG
ncbi:unnamed protein product [Alternaria burnsii]|nr:unnamed protein product [Alternaria burnsii]